MSFVGRIRWMWRQKVQRAWIIVMDHSGIKFKVLIEYHAPYLPAQRVCQNWIRVSYSRTIDCDFALLVCFFGWISLPYELLSVDQMFQKGHISVKSKQSLSMSSISFPRQGESDQQQRGIADDLKFLGNIMVVENRTQFTIKTHLDGDANVALSDPE